MLHNRFIIPGGRESSTESLEFVPLLCNAEADPNAQTCFGESLILVAIDAYNAASVYAFVSVGAVLDQAGRKGRIPRNFVNQNRNLLAVL